MKDFGQEPQQSSNNRGKLIFTLIVVLAIAVAVVFWLTYQSEKSQQTSAMPESQVPTQPEITAPTPDQEPDELVPDISETVELETQPEPEPEPEMEMEPLPALAESTEVVLQELERAEQNITPIQSEQLIRDSVVFIDNLRNGVVIRDKSIIEGSKSRFRVLEQNDKLYIDPRSYDRYNTVVDWFVSLDTDVLVQMLDHYEPLINEALAEIGYPDTQGKIVLTEAIDKLLETPSVGTVIELNDDSVMYRYADPALEALPDAQKQMLRLGPDNIRRVKLKLSALKEALEQ